VEFGNTQCAFQAPNAIVDHNCTIMTVGSGCAAQQRIISGLQSCADLEICCVLQFADSSSAVKSVQLRPPKNSSAVGATLRTGLPGTVVLAVLNLLKLAPGGCVIRGPRALWG
jgi:hypothetical protein